MVREADVIPTHPSKIETLPSIKTNLSNLPIEPTYSHFLFSCFCSDDTVNYAEVYALIRQQMEQPVNLLEHLAHRITQGLYAQFPQIQAVKLSVTKVTPPISGIACEGASFCLQSIRE